jgi:16S rRNA (guanine527-N7)-methyltransferase
MERLLGFAEPFLRRGASGLFLKGKGVENEIAEAKKTWRFKALVSPSHSGLDGAVVKVRDLSRV